MADKATKSWIKSERDEKAVAAGCWFDESVAGKVQRFFSELLVHSKGKWAGRPFELLPWQFEDVIGPIFGWMRQDGSRRYRRSYIEIPKKNGKSTLAAGVALYLLVGDREPGAHVFSAAADRDQASLVYSEAANMVDASTELQKVLTVRRSFKRILFNERNASYEAISSDADTSEGLNAHGLILDELHAWKQREFYESLMYAGRAREQPLCFVITTAGGDVSGICYEQHEYAKGILDGNIQQDSFFVYIRAAGPDDDWKDPDVWARANPSLGATINVDTLADDCAEAQDSPSKENAFRRYTLNQWIGASEGWLSMDAWDDTTAREPLDVSAFRGAKAWGGLDLSQTRDLSALVWLVEEGGLYYLFPRIWIPETLIKQKERIDHVPYGAWIQNGWMRSTPGESIHQDTIKRAILEDVEFFAVQDIGYDPYSAKNLCEDQLELEHGLPMTAVNQSMPVMGPASVEFEALVKDRKIRHGNNPVMKWMAGGCAVQRDNNDNFRPVKRKSVTRIDGIVASIMALSRFMAEKPAETGKARLLWL